MSFLNKILSKRSLRYVVSVSAMLSICNLISACIDTYAKSFWLQRYKIKPFE